MPQRLKLLARGAERHENQWLAELIIAPDRAPCHEDVRQSWVDGASWLVGKDPKTPVT